MSPTSTPPQTALSIQPLTVLAATRSKKNPISGDRQRGARSLMKRLVINYPAASGRGIRTRIIGDLHNRLYQKMDMILIGTNL